MDLPLSVFDQWTQENNDVVKKFQLQDGGQDVSNQIQTQTQRLKWFSSEFHKLLRKIQGISLQADHAQLELAVVYNACVCSIAQSQFSEAELLFRQATDRVVRITGDGGDTSDLAACWKTIFKSVENTPLKPCVVYLFCLQWSSWLATCQLKVIQYHQSEISSLCETLWGEVWDDRGITTKEKLSNIPMLMMNPRTLSELLQICTSIMQGAEMLTDGRWSEALSSLQKASVLPAPRSLLALVHLLSAFCLDHMSCPQMALQSCRTALETDPRCTSALYQSMLIFRRQGNTQAEIQALRLLLKTLMMPSTSQPTLADTHPLTPSLFLSSQSLATLLSMPSALSVLHSMALKCVLNGSVSEGVEHYLDLLATLHSEDQNKVFVEVDTLPRLPELYLEAGAALLIDQRPVDCMTLCNEVISTTIELLPKNVVLEEPEEKHVPEMRELSVHRDDKVSILFWTSAAYLLQGHCHMNLRDWKQAVTQYTRCINLLVKVCCKRKGSQPQIPTADISLNPGTDLYILQRLKGISLAGRGISFAQMDQLKEALRDLKLSLHAFPDCVGSGLWCGEVLWRLSRTQEAAACWKNTWSISPQPLDDRVPLYLHERQDGVSLDTSELRHRIQQLGLA